MINTLLTNLPVSDEKVIEIRDATAADNTLQLLRKTLILGWPQHKRSVPEQLLPYWNVCESLSEADGILFKDNRIIIPQTLRPYVLSFLHKSHLG